VSRDSRATGRSSDPDRSSCCVSELAPYAIGRVLAQYGVKPPSLGVDIFPMRIHHRNQAAIVALLAACMLAGCATKMTARELDTRLNRESQTVASRQAIRRVFPVYAQTKMEAWLLRSEAREVANFILNLDRPNSRTPRGQ
jgi:hypothetical protein